MRSKAILATALGASLLAAPAAAAAADDLYRSGSFPAMASDQRASQIGDIITVVVSESSRAVASAQQSSRKRTEFGADLSVGGIDEDADLGIRGGYTGQGEARRAETLVATISVSVTAILPNGDFLVGGNQLMLVNGEQTNIGIQGRVRPADIRSGNTVLSSRVAEARIDYDGKGFVTRSAKPGIVNRILSFLGLG